MKKPRNSPLALAAAAMIATPPAVADPVSLAPPPAQTHAAPAHTAQPAQPTPPSVAQPAPPTQPHVQAATALVLLPRSRVGVLPVAIRIFSAVTRLPELSSSRVCGSSNTARSAKTVTPAL